MKTAVFKNGAHRASISTSHKGAWIKLRITDGHEDVEITLKPSQATKICENLLAEIEVASLLAQRPLAPQDGRS